MSLQFKSTPLSLIMLVAAFGFSAQACQAHQQEANQHETETVTKVETVTLNDLVQSATAVLIAKVDPLAPKAEPQDAEIDAPRIDLEKELDRVREETARSFKNINLGAMVRMKTVQTLKGPKTDILSIPATTEALQKAEAGQLFLVMFGVTDENAVRPIESFDDPWVAQVKAALEP